MSSYVISGVMYVYDISGPTAIITGFETIEVNVETSNADTTFSYDIFGSGPFFLDSIEIDLNEIQEITVTNNGNVVVDDASFRAFDIEAQIGTVEVPGGGTTDVLRFYDSTDPDTADRDFFINIGGEPFPNFATLAEADAYLTNITFLGSVETGPFADENTPIPYSAFPTVLIPGNGTSGNDNLFGTDNGDALNGFAGDDLLAGRDGNDVLDGGDGADAFSGGNGDDLLEGGAGNDRLFGNNDNDTIFGGLGDDLVNGGNGDDVIDGGGDSDTVLVGGGGNDDIRGRSGNDGLNGSSGNDWLRGDSGNDRLFGGTGDDLLEGGTGNDTLGGLGDIDTLHGGDGDDGLNGGGADDILNGDAGADRLFGGTGSDVLNGGAGDDLLVGQAGLDTFVFEAGWGNDTIARYGEITSTTPRVDEVIDVSALGIAFADLTIAQDGFDTVVNVTGDTANSIRLTFVNTSTITEDDFLF